MTEDRVSTTIRAAPAATRLVIHSAGGLTTWPISKMRGTIYIGRDPSCDIVIEDASVSRKHLAIELGDPLRVADMGSRNGSRCGRDALVKGQSRELPEGVAVSFGDAVLLLERADDSLPDSAAAAPIAESAAMRRLYRTIALVARGKLSVIVHGETGVGKERVAEQVHRESPRRDGPFIAINCAALSDSLLESELFGHEKGSFTGAAGARVGILESASKGTVFLDELGETPMSVQVKLLRCIEKGEVVPVGSARPRPIDVRFVAATHRDLRELVTRGVFREDLYFRLNGLTIEVPPLRERREEIESLAESFARDAAAAAQIPVPTLTAAAHEALTKHSWPGNVRELKNVIERAVLLADGGTVTPAELIFDASSSALPTAAPSDSNLDEVNARPRLPAAGEGERERIVRALAETNGNQSRAAEILGMSRRSLVYRLAHYKIAGPRKPR